MVLICDVQGICRGSAPNGYQGTIEQCYCECNQAVRNGFKATTCSWFPAGQFSSGGCSYCEARRKRQSIRIPEQIMKMSDYQQAMNYKAKRADSSALVPFPVRECSCMGCDSFSSGYQGTLEQCQTHCQSIANSFINGQVTSLYLPDAQYSKGSCNCCGYKDPCGLR
ncbi:unnamed protein product [Rotaria sp. Silwood2]|nr:unnamed protein product [Rotaria sp. Silwood2]CAF4559718.1 unnamed protein product [Rotaria sp. Silwood2]